MRVATLVLPLIALSGLGVAAWTVNDLSKKVPDPSPVYLPAAKPFVHSLSGAGLVEPSSEVVDVASELSGVVAEVVARHGMKVKRGDVLFRLDDRHLKSELAKAEAAVAAAQSSVAAAMAALARQKAEPRPESLPALRAHVLEVERQLADDRDRLDREKLLLKSGAARDRDTKAAEFAVAVREAQLAKARAELMLAEAGAWAPDVLVAQTSVDAARAAVAVAQSNSEALKVDLDRLVVRAPIEGDVLQVNIRAGEGVTLSSTIAPIVMGDTNPLHIRVDLDENDASRFVPGAPGVAFLRGHQAKDEALRIKFVRIDPYVIPKRALTGSVFERVDTRVLQVIYEIVEVPKGLTPWCGQQVEVFIEDVAAPTSRVSVIPLPK